MTDQIYSMAWAEWKLEERLQTLRDLNIHFEYNEQYGYIKLDHTFSSGEEQAVLFLCDPVKPVKFHIFDYHFGKLILKLHSEFWHWRFYPEKETNRE